MLSTKDFFTIFVYTLVILICIKLSLYEHPFTYKLYQYNRTRAMSQGSRNPIVIRRLKYLVGAVPQYLYTVTSNVLGYCRDMYH